ncbi:MAG: transcriptional regulator [Flavobacteriaceae bacterium]|jgi:DNA-binding transcriptional MerR regulator|nr:transcriptional regulator [Flavobacteriaceae bacterium]RCL69197.1 MAG: MerR family transcriptional regulator [Cryomorphaceae bacterium]|tara:strand:+ start:990 stop:1307 length:318 start_codon:yes stop_codon:yes gene_type:complete
MELKLPEKLYYNIGEISKAFDIKPSLLRFWEKEFDILNPKKNLRGTRKYSSIDLKNIKLIYDLLKIKGFTLDGAKKKLKSSKNTIQVIKKLKKLKEKLIKIEKEI